MKPALLVMAAGMGRRYGGLKQMDGLGPNGETIMDYSVFDALRGGFGGLVFVIRRQFEKEFRRQIVAKYENHLSVAVVCQELDCLPVGFDVPAGREKPWGTTHATLMGREAIEGPFAAINADDFYGRHSFAIMGQALAGMAGGQNNYCMVEYEIGKTLSASGPVARGVCETDGVYLTGITERTDVARRQGRIGFTDEKGQRVLLDEHTPVSMNMWGFTPDYFTYAAAYFAEFLRDNAGDLQCECYIPSVVNALIKAGKVRVKALPTTSEWFGITYAAEREGVRAKIKALVEAGEYPNKLFER